VKSESISESTTVNEAIRLYPRTVEVFKRFGIDACCGGAAPIDEAAARHGVDPVALMRELQALLTGGRRASQGDRFR
jgi:regulator of cell morphogenesis and NO signaling